MTESVSPARHSLARTIRGAGPAVLLVHGWPHNRLVWSSIMDRLAVEHTVIAPDLPGIGDSAAPASYDATTIADCLDDLCTGLGLDEYAVLAIDAAVPAAFVLAMTRPRRLRAAVLMEGIVPGLPGAEHFLSQPPWWFGFHAVPGLAETVLAGHEAEYLDFFLGNGTRRGIARDVRAAFVSAYTGRERLRGGFGYYRSQADSAGQVRALTARARLTVPTLAIGSHPVGDALARQLATVGDAVTSAHIPDCGHIIPIDAGSALLDLVLPFLRDNGPATAAGRAS